MHNRTNNIGSIRSRFASCVLLVLFAHAFLVSATHFHRFERAGGSAAQTNSVSGGGDASRAAGLDAHTQCLLCRLQRSFTVALNKSSLPVGPLPRRANSAEPPAALAHATQPFGVPSGRAPPLT